MATNPGKSGLLEQITEGMHVYDSSGEEVGKVNFVHFGEPDAVTTESDRGAGEGGGDPDVSLLDVFEDDPDDGANARMERLGYIRIDAKGLFAGDKYVASEYLASVSGNEVALTVSKDSL